MTVSDFFNALTFCSIFAAVILALFFFVTIKGNRTGNKLLSLLLVLFCLQIIYSFTTSNYAFFNYMQWHKLLYLIKQTSFLTGPVIFIYVRSCLKQNENLKLSHIFHVAPFIGSLLFLLSYYTTRNNFVIWESGNLDLYFTILILFHNLTYIVLSILDIAASSKSSGLPFNTRYRSFPFVWLSTLLLGFIALWIVQLNAFAIIILAGKEDLCAYTTSIFALTVFLFITIVMILVLLKPEIYYAIEKYQGSGVDEASRKLYLQKLTDYMVNSKPYLNPDASLQSIANAISLSPRIVSQIINESCQSNIKSYINEYRVRESMRLLSDPAGAEKTVLEILYEVGFNSKSVFNYQFKKVTGVTPQEYRSKMSGDSPKEQISGSRRFAI